MIRTLSAVSAIVVAAALALAVAGCGGGSSSGEASAYGSSGGAAASASSSRGAAVSVARVGGVGRVLVDSKGLTLYYFEKDRGGKSACYGACARAWPPLRTGGAPRAKGGAEASRLGTSKRKDGTVQVTYAGWPLYTYAADTRPGEANGTDVKSFGATWYPLHSNGKKAGH